jgi:lipopolysaccharide export system permease protein
VDPALHVKISLYLLRQIVLSLMFGVGAVLVLAVPGIAVSTVHKIPNPDIGLLASYLPIVFQTLAPYLLPLCFILAIVATYGRLASDREWTAIQMAGFHPARILVPGLLVALGLSGVTWWLLGTQVPRLKGEQREMLVEAAERALSSLDPGRTTISYDELFVSAKWRDPSDPDWWYEVFIRLPDEADPTSSGDEGPADIDTFADRAHIRTEDGVIKIDLYGVYSILPNFPVAKTAHLIMEIPLDAVIGPRKKHSARGRYMTNAQIRERLGQGNFVVGEENNLRYEIHKRSSLSVVYLLFLVIGVPTGLILRRGTQLGALAVASGFGILYYVLSMNIGRELANAEVLPSWAAAWSTTIIGAAVAIPLLRKGLRR